MKILRIIGSMDPATGGPCQGIRNAMPEWLKPGHQVDVVCLDDPESSYLRDDNINIIPLGPPVTSWKYTSKLLPWLQEHIAEYDALIVHGLWQYHGYAVNKIIRKLKGKNGNGKLPKVYIMPHGMLDPYFQKAPDRRLKALRNILYWRFIESGLIENADGILFTCEEEMRLARTTFRPYRPKKEFNVGYGVPQPPEFQDNMYAEFLKLCPGLGKRPFLLFLSRIHPKKGTDILLNAYLKLLVSGKAYKTSLPCLVIAGPGLDTAYGQKLTATADDAGAGDRIFFPGMLNGDAKWGALHTCEAFVLTSHQENFGISVVEALSCSKPVLISDQINIYREIINGGGGYCESDTEEGTMKLLEAWLDSDVTIREKMGRNASEVFSRNFEVGETTRKMIKTITENHA